MQYALEVCCQLAASMVNFYYYYYYYYYSIRKVNYR